MPKHNYLGISPDQDEKCPQCGAEVHFKGLTIPSSLEPPTKHYECPSCGPYDIKLHQVKWVSYQTKRQEALA